MPDLEVSIFNQKLKLSYQENEKERLIKAISALNESWKKFSKLHGKVSDFKIITLISLELQDSIEDYEHKQKLCKGNIDLLKKEITEKSKDLQNNIEKLNKLKFELDNKEEEIVKTENELDEINYELLQIKNKILADNNE